MRPCILIRSRQVFSISRHFSLYSKAANSAATRLSSKQVSPSLLTHSRVHLGPFLCYNTTQQRLLNTTPLKRSLALVALGGTSLVAAIVLGPILLLGLGGVAGAVAFRFWRFKQQLSKHTNITDGDWPAFLNSFIQQQQVLGKEQLSVQKEALKRLEVWAQSSHGRDVLIEHGIHPETVSKNVSMRGSSHSFTTINGQSVTEIKIEFTLDNSLDSIFIATAKVDKEGAIQFQDLRLSTLNGTIKIPLTINHNGGRIIEGEFHDI